MRAARLRGILALSAAAAFLPAFLGASPVRAEEPAPGFIPPREKIEEPYTNDKCLKDCHGVAGFTSGAPGGEPRDMYVPLDPFTLSTHGQRGLWCIDCHAGADPNFHPRTGYTKVDCRACHSETPPAGVFPPDARETLEMRKVAPPPKEAWKGDTWGRTVHAKAWAEGKPNAPFCPDCHTAHAVRRSADPESTVHRDRLRATCGGCHEPQARGFDAGGVLARWRLAGHGKGDLSNRYSRAECVSCHQGEAAHGEETVTGQACPNCHRPAGAIKAGSAAFHFRVDGEAPLSHRLLRWGYNLLVWGAAAGIAFFALFRAFTSLYRSGGDA